MSDEISKRDFDRILASIQDPSSPVGIDAAKTHVMILHRLETLERRLRELEARFSMSSDEGRPGSTLEDS